MGELVTLHVYDISRGMARTLAPQLIGMPLDGVWHTGVVCFGKEYFFGSMGIDTCPPHGTILGQADQLIPMGETQLPLEIVEEWVADARMATFAGERYHLLNHNCNNFSAEFCAFLTGQSIPDHIVRLPELVSSTPMGQMLLQMISQFTTQQY